jgi:AcrR family transcriptional regulator
MIAHRRHRNSSELKLIFVTSDEISYSSQMKFAAPEKLTREKKRERIVVTAGQLFRQYGVAKTTVADIAAELGMSPANIYKFFPSKGAIVEASANRNLDLIRREVDGIARSNGTVTMRIEAVVLNIFRFHQDLFRNERQIFQMVTQAVEESWKCIADYDAFLGGTFEALVKEGMANGEFRKGSASRVRTPLMDALYIALRPHLRYSWTPEENEMRVRAHVAFVISALK